MARLKDKANDILYFIVVNTSNEKATMTLASGAKDYYSVAYSYIGSSFQHQ